MELVSDFPGSRRWLRWWLWPKIRSLIFSSGSSMKASLRLFPSRTTNAVEAFHSVLYRLITTRQPSSPILPQLLQIAKNDGDDIWQFYNFGGLLPSYNRPARVRRSKKLESKLYQASDSPPPDNTEALLIASTDEDDNPRRKKAKLGDVETRRPSNFNLFSQTSQHCSNSAQQKKALSKLLKASAYRLTRMLPKWSTSCSNVILSSMLKRFIWIRWLIVSSR